MRPAVTLTIPALQAHHRGAPAAAWRSKHRPTVTAAPRPRLTFLTTHSRRSRCRRNGASGRCRRRRPAAASPTAPPVPPKTAPSCAEQTSRRQLWTLAACGAHLSRNRHLEGPRRQLEVSWKNDHPSAVPQGTSSPALRLIEGCRPPTADARGSRRRLADPRWNGARVCVTAGKPPRRSSTCGFAEYPRCG